MKRESAPQPNRDELVAMLMERVDFVPETEIVPVLDSVDRVAAEDIVSVNTLPNAPASRMDGIAIRFEDWNTCAGNTEKWQEGADYVFSNTGVAIPSGYDTVVLIEQVEFSANGVLRITKAPEAPGENVTLPGSRVETGTRILSRGTVITPQKMGLLVSCGIRKVPVIRKPRVAVIPTGDELVSYRVPLPRGKNVETNGIVLSALLQKWGAEPALYPIIPDDPEQLHAALRQAVEESDIVVFNGGSSKGSHDYATDVLGRVGEVLVYEVGHGPGKHTSFTMADRTPVIGLVGPPGGAELTAGWYVRPLVCKYLGIPDLKPRTVQAELTEAVKAHVPFDFYTQVQIVRRGEKYSAHPINMFAGRGRGAEESNAVLHIPGGTVFRAGDMVTAELKIPEEYIPDE